MSVEEFRRLGYLQEVNRVVLHPCGLALEVVVSEDGTERFGGVWDYRDDPEGIVYGEAPDMDLAYSTWVEAAKHEDARRALFDGETIQPCKEDGDDQRPDQPAWAKRQETTVEAIDARDGDVVCDANGNTWRFDDRDEFRWTDFDGNGLRREVPPAPLTLLVRNGEPVVSAERADAIAAVFGALSAQGWRLTRDA